LIQVIPLPGLPEITPGDDLAALINAALIPSDLFIEDGDVLVVTSKIVSKAEGRLVQLDDVEASPFATQWATQFNRDPRHVEVVLSESARIARMDRGVIIAQTRHGFICANAGVDASNSGAPGQLVLLPEDSDASARRLRAALAQAAGVEPEWLAVVISDTFGRAWRGGQTNIAIGASGIQPFQGYHGQVDPEGHTLRATSIAIIDELAAAAELVMGKLDRVPVALIRGATWPRLSSPDEDPGAAPLVRAADRDLFR
jgi:coenzyme F420-0:L-glutamate ligase / coenzyme F420-1:gamma-L-glutamate ligase